MHWLAEFFGLTNPSGLAYGFWSGIGSDIGEVTIIGGLIALYRKHSCHVDRCWRIGRLKVTGTEFTVCRRHHPQGAPTHAEVLQAHADAQTPSPLC